MIMNFNDQKGFRCGDLVKDRLDRYGVVLDICKYERRGVSEITVYMVALGYKMTFWADALHKAQQR